MKYLKSFNESLTKDEVIKIYEHSKIRRLCKKYNIENYIINGDDSIDVEGNVDLSLKKLTKLPLKFRYVSGNFWCCDNQLTSLEGSPHSVGDGFYCENNHLTTLEYCPQNVVGDFRCYLNQLITLKYCPQNVGGDFYCHKNHLTSLEYCPQTVGGDFCCAKNQLTSLKYIPKRIYGELACYINEIKNIDYLPYCKTLDIKDNPIYEIFNLFNDDLDLIFDFRDREIIQNDIIIMDRLVEFLEDVGKPQTKEYLYQLLEKEYDIR